MSASVNKQRTRAPHTQNYFSVSCEDVGVLCPMYVYLYGYTKGVVLSTCIALKSEQRAYKTLFEKKTLLCL